MKNKILITANLLLTLCLVIPSFEASAINKTAKQDSTSVYCSPDLFPLISAWTGNYNALIPTAKLKLIKLTGENAIVLKTNNSLSFISSGFYSQMADKSGWREVVGREVTVPVFNLKNPFLSELMIQGISAENLSQSFKSEESRNWATLLKNGHNIPVGLYLLNQSSAKSRLANYLNMDPENIVAPEFENPQEIVSAIQNDIYAIGFCRISDILNKETQQMPQNIGILPIDRNGNGKLDSNEKISENASGFNRAIWIGKFPKSLTANIYSFASNKPTAEAEVAFLKWVLTDGQELVSLNGYTELALAERPSKIAELNPAPVVASEIASNFARLKLILFILGGFVLLAVLIEVLIRYRKGHKVGMVQVSEVFQNVLNEKSVSVMNGLYYDRSHSWAFMEKDGLVKVGVGDFLQHITGTITQIKLKNTGEKVLKCEPVLSIVHEGKQISINSPVSGIVRDINPGLIGNYSLINTSPYIEGWVYRIEPTNWMREIPFLFMGDKYKIWLKDEFSRLKDFLSNVFKADSLALNSVILQDGGEIKDFPLADLPPEVWEEFQIRFIVTSR